MRMRKLFFAAIISGFALRLGIPGVADLITLSWESLRPELTDYFDGGFSVLITLAGIGVVVLALCLNYSIFIKGLKKGKKGFIVVLLGVVLGLFFGSLLLAALAGAPGSTLPV